MARHMAFVTSLPTTLHSIKPNNKQTFFPKGYETHHPRMETALSGFLNKRLSELIRHALVQFFLEFRKDRFEDHV